MKNVKPQYNYSSFENQHLKILKFSHHDEFRCVNVWLAKCKSCGRKFDVPSSAVKTRKSCGCVWPQHSKRKPKETEQLAYLNVSELAKNLVCRRWV